MLQTGITHTQETCLRLALVKDKKFGTTRRLIRVILAAIPIVIGFFVGFDNGGQVVGFAVTHRAEGFVGDEAGHGSASFGFATIFLP